MARRLEFLNEMRPIGGFVVGGFEAGAPALMRVPFSLLDLLNLLDLLVQFLLFDQVRRLDGLEIPFRRLKVPLDGGLFRRCLP